MNQALLDTIESEQLRKTATDFGVGDTVRVHTKVVEGDKERIQVFQGLVIKQRRAGSRSTFTVRKVSFHVGGGLRVCSLFPSRNLMLMGISGELPDAESEKKAEHQQCEQVARDPPALEEKHGSRR